jgi:hypothetical protein
MELHLVLLASRQKQDTGVPGGQQLLDSVLTPALAAIGLQLAPPVIGLCIRPVIGHDVRRTTRVDDLNGKIRKDERDVVTVGT